MTSAIRSLLLASAAALPLLSAPAPAQEAAGFALEVGPAADSWLGLRVALSVFGQAQEPAASYVRGCTGFLTGEAAGVRIDVTEAMALLTLATADDAVTSLVLGTPDGLYRCALRDAQGLVSVQVAGAGPGRYTAWLGGAEGAELAARMIVADRPVSALELRGLEIASLGAPRAGSHVLAAAGARQVLAQAATVHPESPMSPLSREHCAGFGRFDAADAVLTLEGAEAALSLYARSGRDLTIAVRAPDGRVLCNDDAFGLDPAVTFAPAPAGDYHVFVGAYSQGGTDSYTLLASRGQPVWGDPDRRIGGTPRAGRFAFDPARAGQGQLLARGEVFARDAMEGLPMGLWCPGFTGAGAPDAVLTLDGPEALLGLYARSDTLDLVLAARDPAGRWYCNDDAFGLNPGIAIPAAPAGEYDLFVGAYSQGATGGYALFASAGEPNWQDAASGGGLDSTAPPAVGRIAFGPDTRIDPRVIFDIAPASSAAPGDCAGMITPAQPDVVIEARPGLPQLMVYMVSDADGVLVVAGPDGQLHCNDDFDALNPGVLIPNPLPGDYAIFAGTYRGEGGLATLGVTIASPLWVMDREH